MKLKNNYFQLPIKTFPFPILIAISSFQILLSAPQPLKFDKRSLPRLKSFFETLGEVKSVSSGQREKNADAVLALLGQIEGPPTDLETKLLNLLEREYNRGE